MLWTLTKVRLKLIRLLQRLGFSHDWFLIPVAGVIGVLAGLVALAFAGMVAFCDNLFFQKMGSRAFEGPYLLMLIALPALGGLLVGLIQRYIARSPAGHGIPEVIEAMARRGGVIPGRVGIFKAINSSLTIGSGGSAGMEGPIVQIGSCLGSVVGQIFRVGREHMTTLVGCGAAAGLASLFNAPIAAVLFVLEVMLRDYSTRNIMPLVIASVFGTATVQSILGRNEAIFHITADLHAYGFTVDQSGWFIILGILCGLCGVVFIRLLYASERFWQSRQMPRALKPAMGGVGLGIMGIAFALIFQQPIENYKPPVFFSNGYPVISSVMIPDSYKPGRARTTSPASVETQQPNDDLPAPPPVDEEEGSHQPDSVHEKLIHKLGHASAPATAADLTIPLLLAALVLKLVGTCITLGSGGSGGVFAPSLFMGAMLGGAFGLTLQKLGLVAEGTPATFALAGMAGVLAGAVHCPLTAFLLVFEVTRDYKVILPVMLVAILATMIAQVRLRESIYTLALLERGIKLGVQADFTLLRRLQVATVPLMPAARVQADDPAQKLIDLAQDYSLSDFVVCDDQSRYSGMVVGDDVRTTLLQREAIPLMIVAELMRSDLPTVSREETLELVLDKFARHEVDSLAVVDDQGKVLGMMTRSQLMRFYQQELDSRG